MKRGGGPAHDERGNAPLGLVVRRARPSDVARIVEIQEASILGLGAAAYGPARARAWARFGVEQSRDLLRQGTFFVAEVCTSVVGVSGWSSDTDRADTAWLRYVFVHPEAAGHGVGRRLVRCAEASARTAARRRLRLWSSLNAVGFYEGLGYRRLRRATWLVEPDVALDYMLMGK